MSDPLAGMRRMLAQRLAEISGGREAAPDAIERFGPVLILACPAAESVARAAAAARNAGPPVVVVVADDAPVSRRIMLVGSEPKPPPSWVPAWIEQACQEACAKVLPVAA